MKKRILIIEDEEAFSNVLKFNLENQGFKVDVAGDGKVGLKKALNSTDKPNLILLDIMLPQVDGFEVCKRIREKDNLIPILIITAKEEEVDKVLGLELGADDYIVKPISITELLARINRNLIRSYGTEEEEEAPPIINNKEIVVANIVLDPNKMVVTVGDKSPVPLTLKEYDILSFFCLNPDKVIKRDELVNKFWSNETGIDVRSVDVCLSRLRNKIEDDHKNPKFLITKRGVGYFLNISGELLD